MLKDQSSLDRRVSPNNNLTQQLYEQFLVFKDYLDSSRKNKKQTTKTKRHYHQQQYQQQQNRKNSQQQQNRKKSEGEQNPNQSQQKYLKQHKNQDNMIMNTPQPSKKWRKFNAKIQSNSCQDQSQQQIYTNSPQLTSGQKNQWSQNHPIPNQQYHTKSNQNKAFNINLNLNMNQSTKHSQLIAEYTELYEYSIKKVIENNNRRIKKKRKHNQDSQQQHNVKNIASNLQNDFNQEDNDFNKGDNDFNKEDNGSNQEDNDFNKGDKNKQKTFRNGVKNKDNNEIARRLIFNYQDPNQTNFKDIYQKDNQHLIQQNTIDRTQTLVQDLLASFQTRISKVINFHSQRLKKIDRNLSKLRLFIHDNNFEKSKEKEKEEDNYFQTQQKQLTVFKWKDNFMKNESQQNKINKQMQNVQTLQFNQFNEEYVPDDTSSLYSQNTQGRDLLFDQRA